VPRGADEPLIQAHPLPGVVLSCPGGRRRAQLSRSSCFSTEIVGAAHALPLLMYGRCEVVQLMGRGLLTLLGLQVSLCCMETCPHLCSSHRRCEFTCSSWKSSALFPLHRRRRPAARVVPWKAFRAAHAAGTRFLWSAKFAAPPSAVTQLMREPNPALSWDFPKRSPTLCQSCEMVNTKIPAGCQSLGAGGRLQPPPGSAAAGSHPCSGAVSLPGAVPLAAVASLLQGRAGSEGGTEGLLSDRPGCSLLHFSAYS